MESTIAPPSPTKQRTFIPNSLIPNNWEELKPYYKSLLEEEIDSTADLEKWLLKRDEVDSAVAEYIAWLYIKMTCNTADEDVSKQYNDFITNIKPNVAPISNQLNQKFITSPFIDHLDAAVYFPMIRSTKQASDLFRDENISLQTQLNIKEKEYTQLSGSFSIEYNGKELTLQEAAKYLKDNDREVRKEIFEKIQTCRLKERDTFNHLFSDLVDIRDQIAKNADFANYRDYKFKSLNRFDYTPEDCFDFHNSIKELIVPLNETFLKTRKELLGLETLKPWDLEVDPTGKPALKAFETRDELVSKTIECFNKLDPFFGECIQTMDKMKHLDLFSRKGKAPGGYNYPLAETGIPFIFMNAIGSVSDLKVMVHEGGHAIHSFLTNQYELYDFKQTTSEVAELASMTMELFSMEHWDIFFDNAEDLKRAKKTQLEHILEILPWIATVDKFQHWVYTHPGHTISEREDAWVNIYQDFSSDIVNWSGHQKSFKNLWQKQLHIFTVPFYYIEYGMAQLGAVAMWKQFKENKKQAIQNYKAALMLGYTKTIPEIYETAGIKFDFSKAYIEDLVSFLKDELNKLD